MCVCVCVFKSSFFQYIFLIPFSVTLNFFMHYLLIDLFFFLCYDYHSFLPKYTTTTLNLNAIHENTKKEKLNERKQKNRKTKTVITIATHSNLKHLNT